MRVIVSVVDRDMVRIMVVMVICERKRYWQMN